MFSRRAVSSRALSQVSRQVRCPAARRQYATNYEKRTQETLKTSSRLTWLTTTAAIGAAALYYTTSSSPTSANDSSTNASSADSSSKPAPASSPSPNASVSSPGHHHEAEYASDVPKPVEDRHGDTVNKHSIAARKNQDKVRTGKFSGVEFDNHELEHTPGKPGGDFEKKN